MRRLRGLAVWLGRVMSMHVTGREAMSLLQQATDTTHKRVCVGMQEYASSHDSGEAD